MLVFRFICLAAVAAATCSVAQAWEIQPLDGREYVAVESVASFYQLPDPGPVPAPDPKVPPFPLTLTSNKKQMAITVSSRRATINGITRWLAFPVQFSGNRAWISRLDVSKVFEPHFRPEFIKGFEPVTTVVMDAGHGGHDKGANSDFGHEKEYTLDVALRCRALLEKAGFKVVMTRATDVFIPLPNRPAVANALDESIFVSVHFNGAGWNPAASGFEIFSIAPAGAPATDEPRLTARDLRVQPGNQRELPSGALASSVFNAMLGRMPVADRGMKHARFAVLRLCERPAILVEGGFLTNATEAASIAKPEWREQLAAAICEGIGQYKLLAEQRIPPKTLADYRKP